MAVKILFYGINGTGLGHISRLLNIAREARALLHAVGEKADFQFLTTSEAPQMAWDFPVWKLPSKTIVAGADTSNRTYAANCRFFITNLLGTFRPDILVVDTIPEGSFNEFVMLRDFCKATVFINRHTNETVAKSAVRLSHLALYDLVLVPDVEASRDRYVIPEGLENRFVFTGYVHGFRREDALTRPRVRKLFGVKEHQRVIYISAGGGGDKRAEENLRVLVDTVSSDPNNVVLVGYGPLYRGDKIYRENVIPLSDPDTRKFFDGVEVAFSAAGYNTYQELLAASVPTAFFAQRKGMDCQDERVRLGVEQGWHVELKSIDPESVAAALAFLTDRSNHADITEALSTREKPFGALASALEILKLHSSLKGSRVDFQKLHLVAALRRWWECLWLDTQGASFADVVAAVLQWKSLSVSAHEMQAFCSDAIVAVRDTRLQDTFFNTVDGLLRFGVHLTTLQKSMELRNGDLKKMIQPFLVGVSGTEIRSLGGRKKFFADTMHKLLEAFGGGEQVPLLIAHVDRILGRKQFLSGIRRVGERAVSGNVTSAEEAIVRMELAEDRLSVDELISLLSS